jgi:hypothetical protein
MSDKYFPPFPSSSSLSPRVGGPCSLSEHVTDGNSRIYIFGDIHSNVRCYCRKDGIEIVDFLRDLFSQDHDIDLYLEIDRDVKDSWEKEPTPDQTIYYLYDAFSSKDCRVHYVDVRYVGVYTLNLMKCSNFFTKYLHKYLFELSFDKEATEKIEDRIDSFRKLFPVDRKKIFKETGIGMASAEVTDYFFPILDKYTFDVSSLFSLLESYVDQNMTQDDANKLLDTVNNLSLFMLTITDINVCNLLKKSTKAIIYIGEDHANNIREYLGADTVVASSNFQESQCISLADFVLPFFSDGE